jgi:hypothetical protein
MVCTWTTAVAPNNAASDAIKHLSIETSSLMLNRGTVSAIQTVFEPDGHFDVSSPSGSGKAIRELLSVGNGFRGALTKESRLIMKDSPRFVSDLG